MNEGHAGFAPRPTIPSGWSFGLLGARLKHIDAGASPDLPDRPATLGEWGVLKVSSVKPSGLGEDENKVVENPQLVDPSLEVRHGDVLISRANTPQLVGLACYVRHPRSGLMLSDKTLRLVPDLRTLDAKFLNYLLQSPEARRQIEVCGTGSSGSMKNISQADIRALILPFPPLPEQLTIAQIIGAADEEIRSTERLVGKLEQVLDSLRADLLQESAIRLSRLPDNWRMNRLDHLGEIAGGVTLGGTAPAGRSVELPYLRVANVQDGYIDTTDIKTVIVRTSEVDRYLLQAGDVLMTEGGDFDKLGRGAVWDGSIDPCLHQNHIFRVRCDKTRLLPEYLSTYSASAAGRSYFVGISKQTTNLASINKSQLSAFPVPLPPLATQKMIIGSLGAAERQISSTKDELAKLRLVKQGLMDDLLSGRIRVSGLRDVSDVVDTLPA